MERLDAHLRGLEPRHVSVWYAHNSLPGTDGERERDSQLYSADIILFLVSPDFISSREHNLKEVLPAMERYHRGETRIIPIILRPVHWQETSFGNLLPLPDGGKPVADWKKQDDAFFNVVDGIKRVVQEIIDRSEKHLLHLQQDNPDIPLHSSPEPASTNDDDASTQLGHIIQNFKSLRSQIANYVQLKGDKGFNAKSCEDQYDKLYGDTIVFLTRYLPERVKNDSEGFVAIVQREAAAELHRRSDVYVAFARWVLSPLEKLEKLAAQINACTATLELYRQKYFPDAGRAL